MTVELTGDPPGGGFGILLQGSTFSRTAAPLVAYIEPESPADRCGMLQVGDRLLVINGISTCGLSVAEAARYLQEAALAGSAKLELEFDVAESMVPSSGTFHIKLPKKKGTHIGIKLSSPARRKFGDPLIISDIQKGSIAHRTGTLECGVQILAVGAASLEGATVSEAMQTLNRQDGFVRLTIRKNLWQSDAPTPAYEEEAFPGMICYTVELRRYGGPLGITISGTETTRDPILISGLSRGGLAEKTGAIHIGDQILAIDGVSLQGRPLSEAIHLLQRAGETVCLNIVKRRWVTDRQAMRHHDLHGDLKSIERSSDSSPLSDCSLTFPSMDSAVESWDSSTLETTCSSHGTLHGQVTSKSSGKRVEGSVDQRHSNTLHPPTYKAMSVDTHNMGDIFKDLSVVLHRSDDVVDFGFSITDTLAEKGVYITSVRPGGPADRAGLKPLDRILQVNGVKAVDGGCGTIIPLVTDSPPGLQLLVRRVRCAEPTPTGCPGKGHSESRRRSYPAFPGSPKPCLLGDGQGSLGRVMLQSDTERVQPAGQEQQSNINPL
uniref:glutamate receptor-interacting protein 1-like n=1 Tax=Myxine glutinosa TaxID=7769 RepID=UPI00358F2052